MRGLAFAMAAGFVAGAFGCSGGDDLNFANNTPPIPEKPLVPAPGGMRLLLGRQYIASVRVILGDVAATAAAPPAPDPTLHDFESIGAAELALPSTAVEQYEASADAIARAVIADAATRASYLPCEPSSVDDTACLRQIVTQVGRLAWRRPLDNAEVQQVVDLGVAAAAEYQTVDEALHYSLLGLLESPYFIYMVEVGEPDPSDATRRILTQAEMASRMSFFLLGATPTKALLDTADAGGLATVDDVRAVAHDMLDKTEAKAALRAYFAELYHIREVDPTLGKNLDVFPNWTPELAASMQEESYRLIDDIVWTRNADAREIFTADYAFIDGNLAALYGVPSPGAGFHKVTLPAEQKRPGFLGNAAFLARFAHPAKTSPTRRGRFVKDKLLCDPIPPPPPGVNTTLPDDEPGQATTLKQKLMSHMENDQCKGCHGRMDPIGFAFEGYDGIGAYRTKDNGLPVDPTGTVEALGTWNGPTELATVLAADARSSRCFVQNLIRQSMGHVDTVGEEGAIDNLDAAFATAGYSLKDLLVELVASPAFSLVSEPK